MLKSHNQTTNELFKQYKASKATGTGFAHSAEYIAQVAAMPAKAFYAYLSEQKIFKLGGEPIMYEHVSAFIYGLKDHLEEQALIAA